ncbi:hypothetical protein DFH06DRAFT_1236666, partial [Mycena polygramma]
MLTPAFASITLTVVLSLAAVRSAPVARADFVPQACSGTNGSGTCVDIATAPVGQHVDAAGCTNVNAPKSLKLNVDNDCVSFTNAETALSILPLALTLRRSTSPTMRTSMTSRRRFRAFDAKRTQEPSMGCSPS